MKMSHSHNGIKSILLNRFAPYAIPNTKLHQGQVFHANINLTSALVRRNFVLTIITNTQSK
jgi:hypothetical protein